MLLSPEVRELPAPEPSAMLQVPAVLSYRALGQLPHRVCAGVVSLEPREEPLDPRLARMSRFLTFRDLRGQRPTLLLQQGELGLLLLPFVE